jgi:HD-GYP domain-containing protein (c-di-GMP phosphodiesterase class II)
MIRDTWDARHGEAGHGGSAAVPDEWAATAAELANEFCAPVAILDARLFRWCSVVGAVESQFPEIDDSLILACRSTELAQGRALTWRRPLDLKRVWLLLPAGDAVVAVAGFQAPADAAPETTEWDASSADVAETAVTWGPLCAEPALRAWGEQTTARFLQAPPRRTDRDPGSRTHVADGDKGIAINRLTRRLRISDPPHHFQTVATTVLRTSLNLTAVAWVPRDPHEHVVVSGEIPGLSAAAYRGFQAPAGHDSTILCPDAPTALSRGAPPSVRRYVSVAAGSLGWLLAVNPLEDREISSEMVERLQHVGSLIVAQLSNAKIYADLKELLFGIIRALTAAIDAKDPYTSGHSERVARIAVRLAEELRMPPAKRSDLYLAGLLHDVGKIGIDDGVLKKTGPLTPEEYKKIQAHVEIGVTILKDLRKLHHILPGVRHHHESMDGSGYPDRLSGDDIPLEARILAVADSFDAMSSNRPYRRRLSLSQIDNILIKGRSVQWDADVIDALFACRSDLEAIRQKGLGESLIGAVDVTLGRE